MTRALEAGPLSGLLIGGDRIHVATTFGGLQLRFGDPLWAVESPKQKLRIAVAQGAGKPTGATAIARLDLGEMLTNAQRYEEALREWREADSAYSALYGAGSGEPRAARSGAALALTRVGRLAEADAAVAGVLEQPLHSTANEAFVKGRLGLLRSEQGRHKEVWARSDPGHRDGGVALLWLARALAAGGRAPQAADAVRRAREILAAGGVLADQALLEQTQRELRAAATAQS